MDKTKIALLVTIVAVYAVSLYLLYYTGLSRTLSIRDYVSDECWYISSGINVARKVLGLEIVPRINSSYAEYTIVYNSSCGVDGALSIVIRYAPLALVDKVDYEKIDAFTVIVPLNETKGMEELAKLVKKGGTNTSCVKDVFPGVLPDAEDVNTYLNTEHPPLVKYVIGLLAHHYGFRFSIFREASFVMAALGLLSIALIAYRSVTTWGRAGLVALGVPLFLVFMDKAVQSMSAVAMLDIYAASLDALAAALMVFDRGLAASFVLGLAASAKYTGIFPLPGLLLYERLRGSSTRKILAELITPVIVVALLWAPFAIRYSPGWVINEIIGALKWHTTSRPAGGPPSTNPLGLLLGRDVFVLYYVGSKPYLEAAAHPAVTLPALVLALFGLPGLLVAACRGVLQKWGAWGAGLAAMYLSAIGGYTAVYLAGNHTLYSFYGVQLSMLAATVLAAYYGYMLAADELSREPLRECACSEPARAWLPVIYATLGMALALWLYGLYPLGPLLPVLTPVAVYLRDVLAGKMARLLVVAATWLLYATIAYRVRGPKPCTLRMLVALTVAWISAGLASFTSPVALFAPVAALIVLLKNPGLVDGAVSGLLLPLTALGLGGRNKYYAASFLAGYAASLLMVLDTGYVRSHLVIILIGAGAGLAIALLRDPLTRLAAASIPAPGLIASTCSALTFSAKEAAAITASSVVVAVAAWMRNQWLAVSSPVVFLVLHLLINRRGAGGEEPGEEPADDVVAEGVGEGPP